MARRKKKIMVADDDSAILDAIKQILEDEGYEVKTTVNGETIEEMHRELPNLLLLDIWMSGTDGRNICKELKTHLATKHIPIIMISANKEIESLARQSGADGFLTKPFEMSDLLAIVKKYTS